MATSPYGFWMSPVTSDYVVADSIRLEHVALDGEILYWSEAQPQKKGRSFVYRIAGSGEPEPITPDDVAATFYKSLGIDTRKEYRTPGGRPVMITRYGNAIPELLA